MDELGSNSKPAETSITNPTNLHIEKVKMSKVTISQAKKLLKLNKMIK
jgi:hypothetical protein